jgi:PleD family two-component response regulator
MIVIINDKLGLAHAVRTTLINAGFKTLLADSAEHALGQLSQELPTLILLGDTEQSLFQQTTLLRNHPKTQNVPIILQSDNFGLLNDEYRFRLGAQGVLSNSQSSASLMKSLKTFLNPAL